MKKKERKKTKLIIFPGNFLPHIGGLESHVDNFVSYLSKSNYNYEVTIFSPNTANGKEREIIHNNVRVIRYPAKELVFNFFIPKFWSGKFWKLYKSLYKKKFDVVMTRTMFFTNSSLGMFFAKFRKKKIKLIHVEHASDFSKLDSNFKVFINKLYMLTLGNLTLAFSDKVVGVSSATKEFLSKKYFLINSEKISVIRRGFDYKKSDKIKPNLDFKKKYSGKKILTFVGRLTDGKGVQDALKALKSVKEEYIFLIIGDGEYKNKLEELVDKYKLNDKVNFLGRIPHEEVLSILKISDVMINPSYTEGLPTTVLDGFFTGSNIIATDVGGTYEILESAWKSDKYELIEMKDIKALRKGIIKLTKINSKIDEKLLKEVSKKFDWKNHAKEYDKEIQRILKK